MRPKQARLQNLNNAVQHAVELGAFERAERKRSETTGKVLLFDEKHTPEPTYPIEEIHEFLEDF